MMGSGTVVVYVATTFILKEISPRSKKLFVQTACLNQYFGHLEKNGFIVYTYELMPPTARFTRYIEEASIFKNPWNFEEPIIFDPKFKLVSMHLPDKGHN